MANGAWNSKADIVKDLTKVTGRKIDENFIVRGYRPPPPIRSNEEDEEMRLLFRDHYNNGESECGEDFSKPDLLGIREMLQLVNDLEDGEGAKNEDPPLPGEIITISKLNPNVREFVPRSIAKKPADQPLQNVATSTEPNKNNLDSEYIRKISDSLKSKIKDASKSDTFQSKREKNVAIATLLKLHVTTKVVDDNSSPLSDTPVLIPPEYYMTKHPPKERVDTEQADIIPETLTKVATSTPIVLETSPIKPVNGNEDESICNSTPIKNTVATESSSSSTPYDADKEIKISIDKVESWLNGAVAKKKTLPVFGKITFRKKESNTISPVDSKHSSVAKKTKMDSKEFVPSSNALKQTEIYMQRIKEREIAEKKERSIVTLDNLEETLKARDEKIRSELNSSFTHSNTSTSTS